MFKEKRNNLTASCIEEGENGKICGVDGEKKKLRMTNKIRVAIGLSGGVDSATSALLLKEKGYEVAGVTMKIGLEDEDARVAEAREVAKRLDIDFLVFDLAKEWAKEVASYIQTSLLAGLTPNPCVKCNEKIKFSLLPRLAFSNGFDKFATGHYAKTYFDQTTNRAILQRGNDRKKDQSYFLYRVEQEILARTIFPLGDLTKQEVRKIAAAAGFAASKKPDSQDFCAGDITRFMNQEERNGVIVNKDGKILAHHKGFWNFTVGQRKGLGIGGGGTPYYVTRINGEKNEVVVAFREEALVQEFEVENPVWVSQGPTQGPVEALVKVRSAGEPKAGVQLIGTKCICPGGIFGVAPGQSAVFYSLDGERVLAGGIIKP